MNLKQSKEQDTWTITVGEYKGYCTQFEIANTTSSRYVSGAEAKKFFASSGLPLDLLGKIWSLSDRDGDRKLNRPEFALAMFLIKIQQSGEVIPSTLPDTLVQSVEMFSAMPNMSSSLLLDDLSQEILAADFQQQLVSSSKGKPSASGDQEIVPPKKGRPRKYPKVENPSVAASAFRIKGKRGRKPKFPKTEDILGIIPDHEKTKPTSLPILPFDLAYGISQQPKKRGRKPKRHHIIQQVMAQKILDREARDRGEMMDSSDEFSESSNEPDAEKWKAKPILLKRNQHQWVLIDTEDEKAIQNISMVKPNVQKKSSQLPKSVTLEETKKERVAIQHATNVSAPRKRGRPPNPLKAKLKQLTAETNGRIKSALSGPSSTSSEPIPIKKKGRPRKYPKPQEFPTL